MGHRRPPRSSYLHPFNAPFHLNLPPPADLALRLSGRIDSERHALRLSYPLSQSPSPCANLSRKPLRCPPRRLRLYPRCSPLPSLSCDSSHRIARLWPSPRMGIPTPISPRRLAPTRPPLRPLSQSSRCFRISSFARQPRRQKPPPRMDRRLRLRSSRRRRRLPLHRTPHGRCPRRRFHPTTPRHSPHLFLPCHRLRPPRSPLLPCPSPPLLPPQTRSLDEYFQKNSLPPHVRRRPLASLGRHPPLR